MKISNHAKQRLKERLGLPKRSFQRHIENVLNKGNNHNSYSGSFKRYLDREYLKYKNGTNMKVFSNYLYIFNHSILITVFEIPKKYQKQGKT